MVTLNVKFMAVTTGEEFILKRIIKAAKPIYEFEYTNRDYGNFTCYLEDVERALNFGSWVKI